LVGEDEEEEAVGARFRNFGPRGPMPPHQVVHPDLVHDQRLREVSVPIGYTKRERCKLPNVVPVVRARVVQFRRRGRGRIETLVSSKYAQVAHRRSEGRYYNGPIPLSDVDLFPEFAGMTPAERRATVTSKIRAQFFQTPRGARRRASIMGSIVGMEHSWR
jgi:hypothetical protein